jgi:hypothetical protein
VAFRSVSKSANSPVACQTSAAQPEEGDETRAETSISTGVDAELLADHYDVSLLPDSNSVPEKSHAPLNLRTSVPTVPPD